MAAEASIPGKVLPYTLLAMTVVTGLVDATSYLGLGRIFTANMTGNVVFIGSWVDRGPTCAVAPPTRGADVMAVLILGEVSDDRSEQRQ